MTATCFRRQQQHFTRFPYGRILKLKIWLKCAASDCRPARKAWLAMRLENLLAAMRPTAIELNTPTRDWILRLPTPARPAFAMRKLLAFQCLHRFSRTL